MPAEKLEDTVNRMALEIARVPLEILMVKKITVNRSVNAMGFREMMELNFEMSLAAHFSNTREQWGELIKEKGFKKIMEEWRADTVYDRDRE